MSQFFQHQDQHEGINNLLNQAFPSRQADLRANRAGRLSPNQQTRLQAEAKDSSFIVRATVLLSAFVIFIIVAAGVPSQSGWSPVIGMSVLLIAIGLFLLFIKRGFTHDIQDNSVMKVQGVIKKRQAGGYRTTNNYVDLDQISFSVPHEIYEAFVEGERYILYYTPRSKMLVSAYHVPQSS